MVNENKYSSISEMLSASSADRKLVKDVEEETSQRKIVFALAGLRASKKLTQADIAKCVGCSQSRISKIEASVDEDVKIGDLIAYLKALDMDLSILLHPSGRSITSRVKFHAMCIRRELKKLAGLSKDDAVIAKGAGSFIGESLINFLKIIADAQRGLPEQVISKVRVQVISNGDSDCGDECDDLQENEQESVSYHRTNMVSSEIHAETD